MVMVELATAGQGTDMPTKPDSLVMRPVALHHPTSFDFFDGIEIISAFGNNVIEWESDRIFQRRHLGSTVPT
jgi:hypothetical protein